MWDTIILQLSERFRGNSCLRLYFMFFWCLCPLRYLALYAYKPQKADELELRKGEMYRVTEKCQDGWFKGTSLRTAASGVFPGNYVTPVSRSVRCSRSRGGRAEFECLCSSIKQRLPIPRKLTKHSSCNLQSKFFFTLIVSPWKIKPADQAEYEGRELKLWHLLQRVIVGALFVPLGTKRCLKRKKKKHFERAKFVNALFPCAIMPRSAASLHSLPSFVGISAFTSSHWKVQNYLVTPEAHS